MTPDFNFPTLEEQTDLASAIIRGKVTKVSGDINSGSIEMKVLEYVKGCGDQTIVLVTGFTNSAMCGVGTPKVGAEVVVFVCLGSPDRKIWVLNKYTLFTGMYGISSEVAGEEAKRRAKLGELRNRVSGKYGCCSCCQSFVEKCGRRDTNNNNNNNNNSNNSNNNNNHNNNNGGGGSGVLPPSTGVNNVPAVPAIPALPAISAIPEIPSLPVLPADPDNGFSSIGVPQTPGQPMAPGIPAFPMGPSAPSLPKIPDLKGFDSKMKNILGNGFGGSF